MYITETTDNVRNLIERIENMTDISKLKILIYIFGLLNNKQINDKNEANVDLIEDDEVEIFTLDLVGLPSNVGTIMLQYCAMLYNILTDTKNAYELNGNVLGVDYDIDDKKICSQFEKLCYNEKLDMLSEIIIRYDNETYFKENITVLTLNSKLNGYDIASEIKKYKI